jgi:nicotinate phosphoribosyltransferase
MLDGETIDERQPLTIFHPVDTWKRMTLTDFHARDLLVPVFQGGRQVYQSPPLMDIQAYAQADLATFWDETKRLINPQEYKVDLSQPLYDLKKTLMEQWNVP